MHAAKSPTYVHLDGALTVPHADEIHARLLAAFALEEPIVLDLSAATAIDVSFLQLLVACQKTAVAQRRSLHVAAGGSSLLMAEAARCGLAAVSALNGVRVLPEIEKGNPS